MYSFLGSSETICEAILVKHYNIKNKWIWINEKKVSINFLNWLIGFLDGSFQNLFPIFRSLNTNYCFQIKKLNSQPIYYLKNKFGKGKTSFSRTKEISFWRYYIIDQLFIVQIIFFIYPSYSYLYSYSSIIKIKSNFSYCQFIDYKKVNDELNCWIGFLINKIKWIAYLDKKKQNLFIYQKFIITQKYRKILLNQLSDILKNTKLLPIERQPNGYQLIITNFFNFHKLFFIFKLYWATDIIESRKIIVCKRWWRIVLYRIEPRFLKSKTLIRFYRLIKNLNKFN